MFIALYFYLQLFYSQLRLNITWKRSVRFCRRHWSVYPLLPLMTSVLGRLLWWILTALLLLTKISKTSYYVVFWLSAIAKEETYVFMNQGWCFLFALVTLWPSIPAKLLTLTLTLLAYVLALCFTVTLTSKVGSIIATVGSRMPSIGEHPTYSLLHI